MKHIKLITKGGYHIIDMPEISIDEQIKALEQKRKAQNRSRSTMELVRLAKANATEDELLRACYSFIGSHRPIVKRKPKVVQ